MPSDDAAPEIGTEPPEEIELKLVALDPGVLDELAARSALDGYELRREPDRALHDRYWDWPDDRLRARKISLRLRLQDGRPRLTLKGGGTIERGLARHPELEVPADAAGWRRIRAGLARMGPHLPEQPADQPEPADWFRAAGLEIRQDRRTTRRVLVAYRDGRALAELALDVTTFHLGMYDVVFREIEVESLSGEPDHVLAIGAILERTFGGRVRPSEQNKYARGLELAQRLA